MNNNDELLGYTLVIFACVVDELLQEMAMAGDKE